MRTGNYRHLHIVYGGNEMWCQPIAMWCSVFQNGYDLEKLHLSKLTRDRLEKFKWKCKWDPDEFPLEEFKRMFVFIFLQALRCPMTQINGFKIINDYTGTNLKHLKVCTPQNLYLEYHIAYVRLRITLSTDF
ncbi:hypothetical protein AVEN_12321-1 [Araneus ventricosus]|uniref:Uncharacterized protein n=1 Tax=Araneus ventricosus TaxID=182803 RepID=A0A4Y2HEG8_ARAVE|nr:hypothetical protein AVEN_12321-1 [Araneus ventricosus]